MVGARDADAAKAALACVVGEVLVEVEVAVTPAEVVQVAVMVAKRLEIGRNGGE